MPNLAPKHLVLGVQRAFVMFGATVLVPLLTGFDIGVALFASGVGTLMFHTLTQFRIPVYLGSSFAYIPPILAITKGGSLAEASGSLVWAGAGYLVAAIIFRYLDARHLYRLLPSHVTGPMIILIGLILAPVAIQNASGVHSKQIVAAIGAAGCWGIASFTFITAVLVRVLFARIGKPLLASLPVLIAICAGFSLSAILGVVDFSQLKSSPWIGLPQFSWPVFTVRAAPLTLPVVLVTIVEHFGDILAIGSVVQHDFIKHPGIHRTLLGDGLATTAAALMGGPANTTYSENTGAVALTGNHDPVVMRIAAVVAMLLAVIPKFTTVIAAIPQPVIGGVSVLLFGMIASIGIKMMVNDRVNLTDPTKLIVTSVMLVLGLGGANISIGSFEIAQLGLAAVVGLIVNVLLKGAEQR